MLLTKDGIIDVLRAEGISYKVHGLRCLIVLEESFDVVADKILDIDPAYVCPECGGLDGVHHTDCPEKILE